MAIFTNLTISGVQYGDAKTIDVVKTQGDYNSASSFDITFDSPYGRHANDFSLNEEVIIKIGSPTADQTIFRGIIEDIDFTGRENSQMASISGRDYIAILQDVYVMPRIFTNTETSQIVKAIITQNVTGITTNNVNVTSTTIPRITFNNISVYDALQQLAEISGYYFFVDEDKDLNFIQNQSVSSGVTFGTLPSPIFKTSLNTSGTTVVDEINGLIGSGQSTGSITWPEGKIGSAMNYDGIGEFNFYNPSGLRFSVGSSFSVSAWTYVSGGVISETQGIVGKGAYSACNYSMEFHHNPLKVRFGMRSGTASYQAQTYGGELGNNETLTSGVWYHLVGTYEPSNKLVSLYLNGELVDNRTSLLDSVGPTTGSFIIGRNTNIGGNIGSELGVAIDDVRVYDKTLNPLQVKAIYNLGSGTEAQYVSYNDTVRSAKIRTSDSDIFNYVSVYGDRQLTGAREEFTSTGGSDFNLDAKPFNVTVFISGAPNLNIAPGGIENINDPASEDVKFLVNYNASKVILTSGTTAGDNVYPAGSVVLIDYQRSTPLIRIREDTASQTTYGLKQKNIIDRNIKDVEEAVTRAETFLEEHKDPKIQVSMNSDYTGSLTPGNTVNVNIPNLGVTNQTYSIVKVKYDLSPQSVYEGNFIDLTLNKKVNNFLDIMKEQELRLRRLEASEIDTSVTSLQLGEGSVGVLGSGVVSVRSIGSAFFFGVDNHNILNSPSSLLGDMRAGSTLYTLA